MPVIAEACERRTLFAATFAPAIQLITDRIPRQSTGADFNGDGLPDIAVVIPEQNEVSVLLNNGDGTFKHVQLLDADEPRTIAAADFNNDGIMDLAVYGPNLSTNTAVVRIYNGRGNGTFARVPKETQVFTGGPTLVPYDVNGDGRTDLVATTNGRLVVLINNGNSTFAKPKYYLIGDEPPTDLAIGDFNGDGVADVAVTRGRLSKIAIFLGNPSDPGTFDRPTFYDTGGNPSSVTLGDFNGDGKLDAAVSNEQFRGSSMAVMLGNGDGTLRPASLYQGSSFADRIVSGDFSGSGHDDIIVGAFDGSTQLYTNDGNANFAPGTLVQNAQFTQFISTGDFNNDGKTDLVVTPYKFIRVLLNTSGTQTPPVLGPGLDQTITAAAAASFYTSEGTQVSIGIKGPGKVTLHFSSTQTINIPRGLTTVPVTARTLDGISITGSTAATTLTVRTLKGSSTLNISSLTTDSPIGTIDAPRLNLATLTLPGGATNIRLLSANNGSMTIGGTTRPTLQIGQIGSEVVNVTPAINTLQLAQDASSITLTTPAIGKMTVGAGIVNSTINLTASTGTALGSLAMVGGLKSSTIFSSAGLGTLMMGQMISSRVLAGVGSLQPGESVPTTAAEFASNASIQSLTVQATLQTTVQVAANSTSLTPTFANSSIAAFNIGTLNLGRVQTFNGGTPFGLASHFIRSVTGFDVKSKRTFVITRISSSAIATSAFARRRINPEDLFVRIV